MYKEIRHYYEKGAAEKKGGKANTAKPFGWRS